MDNFAQMMFGLLMLAFLSIVAGKIEERIKERKKKK